MNNFEILLDRYKTKVNKLFFDLQNEEAHQELRQPPLKKPKMLIIEDRADEWFLIHNALSRQFPAAELVWLSSLEQTQAYVDAYSRAESSLPVLILLDLYLPKAAAGFSLLHYLKTNVWFKTIPLIVMSRSSTVEDIGKAYKYASNGYIVKPERDWIEAFTLLDQYWAGDGPSL